MKLYIEVENGQVKNHPALEDNLIQAFGIVPEHWEPFIRVEEPVLEAYKFFDDPKVTYEKINGVWTDVFHIRDMTVEEKTAKETKEKQEKIDAFKEAWARFPQRENWATWVFNEETIAYDPPIPRPAPDQEKLDAGISTFWCGAENRWKDSPVRPEGDYEFDFFAWQWIATLS
jgi:hypothetical protein